MPAIARWFTWNRYPNIASDVAMVAATTRRPIRTGKGVQTPAAAITNSIPARAKRSPMLLAPPSLVGKTRERHRHAAPIRGTEVAPGDESAPRLRHRRKKAAATVTASTATRDQRYARPLTGATDHMSRYSWTRSVTLSAVTCAFVSLELKRRTQNIALAAAAA